MKARDYEHMFELIGVPLVSLDDIIPDSKIHTVFFIPINEMGGPDGLPINVTLTGSQWDFLWWIYRLRNDFEINFDMFLIDFIAELYKAK